MTLTIIGLILVIIGMIAWLGGILKVANLQINLETAKGRRVLNFSILHIFVGLVIIVIDILK